MDFLISAHTDVGIRKHTNQDSVLIKVADTDYGKICFAVICDGMGGLLKGELASATLIRAFSNWFEEDFPELLYTGLDDKLIRGSMERVISRTASMIARYAATENVKMGTTVAALLITQQKYYVVHVGDSRVYEITDKPYQLTKDQTFIQREMDLGHMTLEEAKKDPRRNMLLQCVGASNFIEPEFYVGVTQPNAVYMLCSDGFRHVITWEEIYQYLNPYQMTTEDVMTNQLVYLTELNKYRREDDNISVAAIRTF